MVNKFWQAIKKIYALYIQAILFIAGFICVNIAIYSFSWKIGILITGITLILFALIINSDQEKR